MACEQANDRDRASTARMSPATKDEKKRIEELERALARKDRALAETAALLVLKKKGGSDLGGATRTQDQHPTSPSHRCSDRSGRHRWRTAR